MLPSRGRLVGENMQQRLPHESIDNVGKHVFFVFLGTFSFYRNGTSNQSAEMPINSGRACSFRALLFPEMLLSGVLDSVLISKEKGRKIDHFNI